MARVLIVGCGCHGIALADSLAASGITVRGTSRSAEGAERISRAGHDGVVADPDRVGTVLEQVGDVAVVVWALAKAGGPSAPDVNGPRLERMLERLVDTPVRGFVLELPADSPQARDAVNDAGRTWRIPTRVVEAPRAQADPWRAAMGDAVESLLGLSG
jgi:hypothetical protein